MSTDRLKIVFAGTPAFGLPVLKAIAGSEHALIAVYTQPDKPAGRGLSMQSSPIKEWALNAQIPVYQPPHFKSEEAIQTLASLNPDLLVVIAYGLILPPSVLAIPRLGAVNVHASLLPRWRGASPIQAALLAGDVESGVSIMQLDAGMDTGPVYTKVSCTLASGETAGSLHDALAELAINPLIETLNALAKGGVKPVPQNNAEATYAKKIKKEEACISWTKDAASIDRLIRAYNPWPIAYTTIGGARVRIYEAYVEQEPSNEPPGTIIAIQKNGIFVATGSHLLRITRIQWEGGKVLNVSDWFHAPKAIALLGSVFDNEDE